MVKYKRRYNRKRRNTKKVAKSVKKYVTNKIDKMQEDKWNYFFGLGTTITSDSLLQFDLCATTKGTNPGDATGAGVGQNRIGAVIRQKRVEIRMTLRNGNPATVGTQYVRWILAYDMQQNGAQAALNELFINGTGNQLVTAPISPFNKDRFRILRQGRITLNQANGSALAAGVQRTIVVKLRDRLCHYNNGNAGTYADIISGGLKLFMVSNVAAASNPPNMEISAMLFFEDA